MTDSPLRHLPAVHRLLDDPQVRAAAAGCPHALVADVVRRCVESARAAILAGRPAAATTALVNRIVADLQRLRRPSLRRVINGTGVVLNTNLGRAPLPAAALQALQQIGSGYSNLEYDLDTGERGSRHDHLSALLQALTGAEAALVVNNNAAAVLLVASCFASGREIVVSRGQLVEIGGSFRLPDVIAMSGARLVEVGTTNKTYARDYAAAITTDTGLLLRCHPSNFRLTGFTHEASAGELAELGHAHGVTTCEDLGSGQLVDLRPFGLPYEPTVDESVAAGLDLVTFSGDKLLGGPQAGIIVGREAAVARLRRHPLLRALRPDKLTLAALHATLGLYINRTDNRLAEIPTYRMLTRDPGDLRDEARLLADLLHQAFAREIDVTVESGETAVGGGSLPGATLPTAMVAMRPLAISTTAFARRLRQGEPALVGRIQDDRLLIDPRTLLPGEAAEVPALVRMALETSGRE